MSIFKKLFGIKDEKQPRASAGFHHGRETNENSVLSPQSDLSELSYEQLKELPNEQLVKAISGENEKLRSHAVFVLGERRDVRAIELLIEKLRSGRFEERRLAAMRLGDYEDKNVIDPLIDALQDEHEHVRYSAATSLGNFEVRRCIAPLRKLISDSSEMVARAANESLDKLSSIANAVEPEAQEIYGTQNMPTDSQSPSQGPDVVSNVDMQLERLNTEDYVDRIDAIMDISSNDHEKILHKLIEIAVSAMRGEVRIAAAVGLCEYRSDKKVEFLEKYLSESEGYMLSGGDPKATIILILAVMDGSYDLGQVLEKHPDVKGDVLEYLGKAERNYKEIISGIDQIAYLLTWCAGIDMGYGDRSFVEYIRHKTKASENLVSSILKCM